MRLENFLKKVIKRNINISNEASRNWSWFEYNRYAELTSMVDFRCDFDQDGICRHYLHHKEVDWEGKKRTKKGIEALSVCCCRGCRDTIGHLNCLPNSTSILEDIAYLFDEKTGFWRLGVGCILPRKYRSHTCLFHRCNVPFRKNHPFLILESMMDTWWLRKQSDSYYHVPPKMFQEHSWGGKKHRWVSYGALLDLMNTEFEKDKRRRKRKSK
jgi:hypothetical protein